MGMLNPHEANKPVDRLHIPSFVSVLWGFCSQMVHSHCGTSQCLALPRRLPYWWRMHMPITHQLFVELFSCWQLPTCTWFWLWLYFVKTCLTGQNPLQRVSPPLWSISRWMQGARMTSGKFQLWRSLDQLLKNSRMLLVAGAPIFPSGRNLGRRLWNHHISIGHSWIMLPLS